jgi:hypothetical protein
VDTTKRKRIHDLNDLIKQKTKVLTRLYTFYLSQFEKRVKIMLIMTLFISQVTSLTIPKVESTTPSSVEDINVINVALNADVTLHGGPFFVGRWAGGLIVSDNTLVDGVFLPRSAQWDQGSVWWDSSDNVDRYITLNLGQAYTIESFIVQADDNDAYLIYYWDMKNSSWELAWHVPNYDMYLGPSTIGMQTRPNPSDNSMRYVLPQKIVTDKLMLKGEIVNGDQRFSVSEIQAYAHVEKISFNTVGISTDYSGTVLTLDGALITFPQISSLQKYSNTQHTYSWKPTLEVSDQKRYICISTSSSPETFNGVINSSTENASLTAVYKTQYCVSFESTPVWNGVYGGKTPQGKVWYDEGETVQLEAEPNTGYEFVGWTSTGSVQIETRNKTQTKLTVFGSGIVRSEFQDIMEPEVVFFEPDNQSISWDSKVLIGARYTDNAPIDFDGMVLRIDGLKVISGVEVTGEQILISTDFGLGNHIIELTMKDVSGNAKTTALSFTVLPWTNLVAGSIVLLAIIVFILVRSQKRVSAHAMN